MTMWLTVQEMCCEITHETKENTAYNQLIEKKHNYWSVQTHQLCNFTQ